MVEGQGTIACFSKRRTSPRVLLRQRAARTTARLCDITNHLLSVFSALQQYAYCTRCLFTPTVPCAPAFSSGHRLGGPPARRAMRNIRRNVRW